MTTTKGEIKVAEFRARALEASAQADAASLERVRELRRHAAEAWTGMADAEEARMRATAGR